MPGPHSQRDDLSPSQREAARMEVLGTSATDICSAVGVSAATLSRWRADDRYWRHVERLMADADRDTLKQARRIRDEALKVARASVGRAAAMLRDELTPRDAAAIGRLALDVYKTTAAQTGVTETTRQEVAVDGAPAALAEVRELLRGGMNPDELAEALEGEGDG